MSQQQWNSNSGGSGDDDVQVPLGVGGDTSPTEEYTAPSRFRVNGSTLTLVAAFAAALIALYLLGLQNKPKIATAQDMQKNQELEKKWKEFMGKGDAAGGVLTSDARKLLKALEDYFRPKNDSLDLPGNPFEHDQVAVEPVAVNTPHTVVPEGYSPELRAAAEEFASLRLQGVMMGNPSGALINNKLVQVGQSPGKILVVSEIQPGYVVLKFREQTFKLEKNGPQMNK